MFLPGENGELIELANPYLLRTGGRRAKPSASLRRMQDVATREDRDGAALLTPPIPSHYPQQSQAQHINEKKDDGR